MDYLSRDSIEVKDCLLHKIGNSYPFVSDSNDTKLRLTWKNVTVRTSEKSQRLLEKLTDKLTRQSAVMTQRSVEILKAASGYAEAGYMIAVMGPSGAGKTTLLDALAKRIQSTSGTIRVNGFDVTSRNISRISSYVPQFDPLPAMLTVGEYIAFSCALRLDRSTSSREREILARDIITNLGLEECQDSLTRMLSGGEKKRLSLAAEIVTMPSILFLDEPTTGLDTSVALRVIESVKPVSANGIVLCSIHQPSMMIYKHFSHVIFLTKGRTAFYGTIDDARRFFESEGFMCPTGFDEAEYYVKILSKPPSEYLSCSNAQTSLVNDNAYQICQAYASSSFCRIPEHYERPGSLKIQVTENKPRWIIQFNWLLWRLYLENRRTIVDGLISFQYYSISIIAICIFFWGIDSRKQRGIQDVMGFLFMASTETIFSSAYLPLHEIEREIPLYQREVTMYGPSAYYLATAISWIPKAVFKALLLSLTMFSLLGTSSTITPNFLQLCVCTIASCINATAYGSMMASLIEDSDLASIIMVPIDLLSMLMAGFFYNLRTLKWYIVGFKYLSIFHYTTEALAIAHWSQIDDIECDTDVNLPCISSGPQVLVEYGYEASNFWLDILGMSVLTILMNFIGYLGTARRRSIKSHL